MCVGDKANFQQKQLSGTHSLHYNLTVRSQGGLVQSRSFADGYWDHQLVLHYDSDNKENTKPQGPWAKNPLGTESWNTEIQDVVERNENLKATLAQINAQQEQKGGSHFLQETWGCKILENNHIRGFWNFHYDGEPFLSYHPETRSWTVEPSSAQTLAMGVKNSWDADGFQSKDYQAHVHGELCGRLRSYVVSWKGSSFSSGASTQGTLLSPAVNVTYDEASEDTINMTCGAFSFYPQNISVTCLQDGKPLSLGTQQSWGVFPYGNGTYQTWVSIRIPRGQEQRICCYVGYRGNNGTGYVSCGEPGHSCRSFQPGTALLLESQWPPLWWWLLLFLGLFSCIPLCKKRRTSAEECSELVSLKVLDQQQRAPSDHTGSTQLGCQPLLRAPEAS
ncbi:MHC class I polypeptide-related sequence B-like isoform 2-T6 [Callospermophilus lateralis]|uniref:MHC class I polypeptide-related sequence B-like isoform X1 n=1 Tax=Callospermophilus lateralis TaxID=76772 RepID=UPI00403883A5